MKPTSEYLAEFLTTPSMWAGLDNEMRQRIKDEARVGATDTDEKAA